MRQMYDDSQWFASLNIGFLSFDYYINNLLLLYKLYFSSDLLRNVSGVRSNFHFVAVFLFPRENAGIFVARNGKSTGCHRLVPSGQLKRSRRRNRLRRCCHHRRRLHRRLPHHKYETSSSSLRRCYRTPFSPVTVLTVDKYGKYGISVIIAIMPSIIASVAISL